MNRDRSPTRILIVENERDAAVTLAMLLKLRGYAVEIVLDSTQCLSNLETFEPHVILLDIGMPLVSGYDVARQIRAQRRFDDVAIIAISGYADRQHKAQSLESGCDQHLVKPVDLATLEAAIEAPTKGCVGADLRSATLEARDKKRPRYSFKENHRTLSQRTQKRTLRQQQSADEAFSMKQLDCTRSIVAGVFVTIVFAADWSFGQDWAFTLLPADGCRGTQPSC